MKIMYFCMLVLNVQKKKPKIRVSHPKKRCLKGNVAQIECNFINAMVGNKIFLTNIFA